MMEIKSKTIKLIIRYTKEYDLYPNFKKNLKEYIERNKIKNENELIYSFLCHTPLMMLCSIGLYTEKDSYYNSKVQKYLFNLKKQEIINIFENFLKKENVLKEYIENINKDFIEKSIRINLIDTKIKDKQQIIYQYLQPTAFLMYAFEWDKTKQRYKMWSTINIKWEKIINKYYNK